MKSVELLEEEKVLIDVVLSARKVQEFLWHEMNEKAGLEEFKRMFRKRLAKIEEITTTNPHWKIEFKKRLLQVAAITVNLLTKIDSDKDINEGIHPKLPSNLEDYSHPITSNIKEKS